MDMESYSNGSGGRACWLDSGQIKQECLAAQAERKALKAKNKDADTDRILAEAVLAKTSKDAEKGMTPIQITGIVFASMMSIAIMIVIIKRVKSKRG